MIGASELRAALEAAKGGETFELAPGEIVEALDIRHQWDRPVTLVAEGATIVGLALDKAAGFRLIGGTVQSQGGAGPLGYAAGIRNGARDIVLSAVRYTNAVRGVVIGAGCSDIEIEQGVFTGLISDGINIASSKRVRVIGNRMSDFRPNRTRCTFPDGQIIEGLSKRDCEAQGGEWADGHHPDGIQLWGPGIEDLVIAGNRIEGDMQGIGRFGQSLGVPPVYVVIRGNYVRTSTGWGINASYLQHALVKGNDVGRMPGSMRKVQINIEGSTGVFCGNINPDARPGDPTVQPCGNVVVPPPVTQPDVPEWPEPVEPPVTDTPVEPPVVAPDTMAGLVAWADSIEARLAALEARGNG